MRFVSLHFVGCSSLLPVFTNKFLAGWLLIAPAPALGAAALAPVAKSKAVAAPALAGVFVVILFCPQ